jgi:hypothetical protein
MIKLQELVPVSLQNKYGNVFMGEIPYMLQKQQVSDIELDTKQEKRIRFLLRKWTRDFPDSTRKSLYALLPDLRLLSTEMPWIKPEGKVYRITQIQDKKLAHKINEDFRKLESLEDLTFDVEYNASGVIQSWATDLDSTFIINTRKNNVSKLLGTLEADSSAGEFFFTPEVLYKLTDIYKTKTGLHSQEKETIRFGNEPLKCRMIVEYDTWKRTQYPMTYDSDITSFQYKYGNSEEQ